MNKLKIAYKGKIKFQPLKYLYKLILDNSIHSLSKQYIKNFPQIAVFSFDHIGTAVTIDGRYENDSLKITKDFLSSKNINFKNDAIDIGANIGNHSIFFADFFNRVHSFEPNPKTFDLLTINCNDKNISTYNYGLSDQNKFLDFEYDLNNIGNAYVTDSKNQKNAEINKKLSIEVKKLDEIEEIFEKKISLIKIDIEGHEFQALRGAKEVLRKNKPVVLFEQHPDDIHNHTSDVIEFLKAENYEFFIIENRYKFGKNIFTKSISFLARLFLGFQKIIIKSDNIFKKRLYEMIIAIPKNS